MCSQRNIKDPCHRTQLLGLGVAQSAPEPDIPAAVCALSRDMKNFPECCLPGSAPQGHKAVELGAYAGFRSALAQTQTASPGEAIKALVVLPAATKNVW